MSYFEGGLLQFTKHFKLLNEDLLAHYEN